MRCEQCEKIPLVEIHTPQEYMLCIGSLARMLLAGEVEMTYQTCPLDKIMDNDNKCTKCGTIYGMLCNTHTGGQIKINDKVFDPADYPDKKEDK